VSPGDFALVAVAGLLCGAVNAVAGGGSLILFPALIASGLPTLAANVTNSVATWPGYVGGVVGFREELKGQSRRLFPLAMVSLAGSISGCALLLTTSTAAFDLVVPALVLFATLLLAAQPRLKRWMADRAPTPNRPHRGLYPALFLATVYGGYFGGALGVIIIGALALTLADSLPRLNALKAALTLVDCSVSVVIFGLFGPVDWLAVAVAAPTCLLGGYLGARLARRLNEARLRAAVITLGLSVTIYLAWKVFF
jgi:uncharacterized membrane protein YfcA